MKELITLYDFLEHIHLSPEEIEFYTMKKRRQIKEIKELTFYINGEEYILYKLNGGIIKRKIIFITGNKHLCHRSDDIQVYWDKHIRNIVTSGGRPDASQFLKVKKDVGESMQKVWEWESEALSSNDFKWKKPVLIFDYTFKEKIGTIRGKRHDSYSIRVELNLGFGGGEKPVALLHGYPY